MIKSRIPTKRMAVVLRVLLFCVFIVGAGKISYTQDNDSYASGHFSPEAAAIFNKRCTACHTYGRGVKVGPDLKGVTERRKRAWLLKFIRGSSQVIQSGDPTASSLFLQFKRQRMPDWNDLSEQQVNEILDYLSIGGPDIQPLDEHNAETATPADIDQGRRLFYGDVTAGNRFYSCSTCHNVQKAGRRGGTLGPDLTGAYSKYQDVELTRLLKYPCFNWDRNIVSVYLTPKESFDIKAFLYQSSLTERAGETQRSGQIHQQQAGLAPERRHP